jgi:hypothetical protein
VAELAYALDLPTGRQAQNLIKTTKPYVPFRKILIEEYRNRKEARMREKYLKSGCGKEYLKSIV